MDGYHHNHNQFPAIPPPPHPPPHNLLPLPLGHSHSHNPYLGPHPPPPQFQQGQGQFPHPIPMPMDTNRTPPPSSSSQYYAVKSDPPKMYQQQQDSGSLSLDKQAVMVVLNFLKKNNLKQTEELLKKEAQINEAEVRSSPMEADVQSVLSSYASDENPDEYSSVYAQLKVFVDSALDAYKYEVGQILWPVFVHLYLELVYNGHEEQAAAFFSKFSKMQETFLTPDVGALGTITKKEHLLNSENPFRSLSSSFAGASKPGSSGVYVIRMSREAHNLLKRFLQEKRLKMVQNLIQDRIFMEVYDGIPRGKAAAQASAGHVMGEALKQDNKTKVYYGLLREPDLQNFQVDEDDDVGGDKDKDSQKASDSQKSDGQGGSQEKSSKKKKSKKDWLSSKKSKNDPNAPPVTRMPLPELRDIDKIEKAKALRESAKRVTLGPDRQPSVCFYTVLNGDQQVTFIKWSEDGTLMGVGFASSLIRVWSLTPAKLKKLKAATDLADIDREADDVLVRMMDDRSAESDRYLRGHSGPVYSLDFSPDKHNLLSSSEDASIRLWSLLTWTCLVVYKGHLFPVWKAVFSPHGGYYFASAGHDRTARLWATDTPQPLRLFAGHYSDVTAILFHPNSNYVATGSADRSVRLWDCVTGNCVRLMTGHKGPVQSLCFSMDGRFLISTATDKKVMIWDMANGGLVTILHSHKGIVYSLSFSREGTILATGGLDHCVRLWDFTKIIEDVVTEEGGATVPPDVKKISGDGCLVGEFYTKNTAIFALHFTRRNVLLASGPFHH